MRTYTDNKTRLWQLREDRAECRKQIRDLLKHIRMVDSEMKQVKDDLRVQAINAGIGISLRDD